MALTQTAIQKEAEQLALQQLGAIEQIGNLSSIGSTTRCAWDVGAQQATPGGLGGAYIRQCRMQTVNGMAYCRIHAPKLIKGEAIQNAKKAGKPITRKANTR